jgi:hypothetical protein
MPQVEGIITSILPGEYTINLNQEIYFTISAEAGYDVSELVVKVNGLELTPSESPITGEPTYTIRNPQTDIIITIEGVKPDTDTKIESLKAIESPAIYQVEGGILVSSPKDAYTYIYTSTGKLHSRIPIQKGETRINLPKGIYLIRINKEYSNKLIIK